MLVLLVSLLLTVGSLINILDAIVRALRGY